MNPTGGSGGAGALLIFSCEHTDALLELEVDELLQLPSPKSSSNSLSDDSMTSIFARISSGPDGDLLTSVNRTACAVRFKTASINRFDQLFKQEKT